MTPVFPEEHEKCERVAAGNNSNGNSPAKCSNEAKSQFTTLVEMASRQPISTLETLCGENHVVVMSVMATSTVSDNPVTTSKSALIHVAGPFHVMTDYILTTIHTLVKPCTACKTPVVGRHGPLLRGDVFVLDKLSRWTGPSGSVTTRPM
jgi:hypothetical protein